MLNNMSNLLDKILIKYNIPQMIINQIDEYREYNMNHKIQMKIVLEELYQLFNIKIENLVIGTEYIVCGNIPSFDGTFSKVKGTFYGHGITTSGKCIVFGKATLLFIEYFDSIFEYVFPTQTVKEQYLINIHKWKSYNFTVNDNLKIKKV